MRHTLSILFVLFASVAWAQTGTLGSTQVGSMVDSGQAHMIHWTCAVAPVDGAQPTVAVFVGPVGAAPNDQFAVAIYSSDGAFLAGSTPLSIVANAWNQVPLTLTLTAGTTYCLAYAANGTTAVNNFRVEPGVGQMFWQSQPFGTWPPTLSVAGQAVATPSIYASYIAATVSDPIVIPLGVCVPREVAAAEPEAHAWVPFCEDPPTVETRVIAVVQDIVPVTSGGWNVHVYLEGALHVFHVRTLRGFLQDRDLLVGDMVPICLLWQGPQ